MKFAVIERLWFFANGFRGVPRRQRCQQSELLRLKDEVAN
jgi:hypothetical protein